MTTTLPESSAPTPGPALTIIRRVGGVLLAAAALVVWFTMAPDQPDDHSDALDAVLAVAELNNIRAEGAPQQAVTNGWVARDLLALTVQQNDLIAEQLSTQDERPAALLALLLVGVGLIAVTSERRTR